VWICERQDGFAVKIAIGLMMFKKVGLGIVAATDENQSIDKLRMQFSC
jgi:hypothetical protein